MHAHFNDHVADYVIPKDTRIGLEEAKIVETSTNPFIVSDITQKETKRNAKPPYMTSTLLQDGVNSLYMSSSRVCQLHLNFTKVLKSMAKLSV